MTLTEAKAIVGRTNSTPPYLNAMIKALSIHSWNNTPEETERLEAAKIVRAAAKTQ